MTNTELLKLRDAHKLAMLQCAHNGTGREPCCTKVRQMTKELIEARKGQTWKVRTKR